MTVEHPDLIDLDTGTMYEWITETDGGGDPGYATVDDHDWAWPRSELSSSGARLVEVHTLDPADVARLRELCDADPDYDA
jgi:hypothetical protein